MARMYLAMLPSSVDNPFDIVKELREIFRKGGLLSRTLPNFEWRPQQEKMALAVAQSLIERSRLLVEAGTGIGKSLAYLIPAILSGHKIVVSTGTKTLQDQLIQKDIPFLSLHLPTQFRAVSLKGKSNYLCLYRYKRFSDEPRFVEPRDSERFDRVRSWASEMTTGDRAELSGIAETSVLWQELSVRGESCLGTECPEFTNCYLMRARQEAAAADIVIVNHHLFFADLALREGGYGQVLPHYDSVIFDEAHQLEEVATQYFGFSISTYRIQELHRDSIRELRYARLEQVQGVSMQFHLDALWNCADHFFALFRKKPERYRLNPERFSLQLLSEAEKIVGALDFFRKEAEAVEPRREGFVQLAERASAMKEDLLRFFEHQSPGYVFWCDVQERGVRLSANPLDVADILKNSLFSQAIPTILTSATISINGGFAYIQDRLGIEDTETMVVDSPFDFSKQAILYIPKEMPHPHHPEFLKAAADQIQQIVLRTHGRAFVLFTSRKALEQTHRLLEGRLPFPLLRQGEEPKGVLLDQFQRQTDSVLFGTASFWQGVDVPGDALSCVIIDKLPFAPPTDPLVEARLSLLETQGIDPFTSYQLPVAILTLKQGLGRLIRHRQDRGVLAVLDTRLIKKPYGKRFLRDLPSFAVTRDLAALDSFFDH